MSRPKYQITKDDSQHAWFYLSTQLSKILALSDRVTAKNSEKAQDECWDARAAKGRVKQAEMLNAWAEKYLSTEEWAKLKYAVRKRRQRSAKHQKTVTITPKAHKLLNQVAKRDEVTFSEAIEFFMAKALRSSRGSAKS